MCDSLVASERVYPNMSTAFQASTTRVLFSGEHRRRVAAWQGSCTQSGVPLLCCTSLGTEHRIVLLASPRCNLSQP